jgi:hypothetical protein
MEAENPEACPVFWQAEDLQRTAGTEAEQRFPADSPNDFYLM